MTEGHFEYTSHMPEKCISWEKKRDQFLISPKGRWGTNWMRWLVFRAAYYLGMVSHHRMMTDSVRVGSVNIRSKQYRDVILQACDRLVESGYDMNDLICLMGSPEWPALAREIRDEIPFCRSYINDSFEVGHPERTKTLVYNVPVVVTPFIKGILVLPKSHLR